MGEVSIEVGIGRTIGRFMPSCPLNPPPQGNFEICKVVVFTKHRESHTSSRRHGNFENN